MWISEKDSAKSMEDMRTSRSVVRAQATRFEKLSDRFLGVGPDNKKGNLISTIFTILYILQRRWSVVARRVLPTSCKTPQKCRAFERTNAPQIRVHESRTASLARCRPV